MNREGFLAMIAAKKAGSKLKKGKAGKEEALKKIAEIKCKECKK